VCAAFFFATPIPSIAAIIYGVVAVRQTAHLRDRNFAAGWLGVILGSLGIVGWIVGSMFVVHLHRASERIRVMSNLRELGIVLNTYAAVHQNTLPSCWEDVLADGRYPGVERLLCDPSDPSKAAQGATTQALLQDFANGGHCYFLYLGRGESLRRLKPGDLVAISAAPDADGFFEALYADGHCGTLTQAEAVVEIQRAHDRPVPWVPQATKSGE
jgi:hypothetical protein